MKKIVMKKLMIICLKKNNEFNKNEELKKWNTIQLEWNANTIQLESKPSVGDRSWCKKYSTIVF